MSEFREFLQELLGDHNPIEIEELVLDDIDHDWKTFNLAQKTALEEYKNLIHLSLNNLNLNSLDNFPSIPNLIVLDLKGNNLTGNDLNVIPKLYPVLHKLKVSYNQISSIDVFKQLENSNIEKIEVHDNPFQIDKKNYRKEIFNIMPKVKIVDQMNEIGQEIDTTIYNESSEGEEEEYAEDNEDGKDDENEEEYEEEEENED